MSALPAAAGAMLIALAVSGCGKGSESAAPAAGDWPSFDEPSAKAVAKAALPKACALVSAEQAEAVLKQPVSLMSDEPENCIWASAGNPGQITMLMVNVSDNDDMAMAQTVFNALTGLQGNLSSTVNAQLGEKTKKSGQELEDLGDEAWVSGSNMDLIGTQQLVVRKGVRILTLNITGMTKGKGMSEGIAARMESLARSAAPQL